MKPENYIALLLEKTECLMVPGLGGFLRIQVPARISEDGKQIEPPSEMLAFNAGLSANDGLLANSMAASENTSYREAMYEINHWVGNIHRTLSTGGAYTLEGLGRFERGPAGPVQFIAAATPLSTSAFYGLTTTNLVPLPKQSSLQEAVEPVSLPVANRPFWGRVRWAAILAPFVALAIWGSIHRQSIGNFVNNTSGFDVWMQATSDKQALVPTPTQTKSAPVMSPLAAIESKADAPMDVAVTDSPAPAAEPKTVAIPAKGPFHVVGGAFRNVSNAQSFIHYLNRQGYSAKVVDTTAKGLYVVSMKQCISYIEAEKSLQIIRQVGYENAWVFNSASGHPSK